YPGTAPVLLRLRPGLAAPIDGLVVRLARGRGMGDVRAVPDSDRQGNPGHEELRHGAVYCRSRPECRGVGGLAPVGTPAARHSVRARRGLTPVVTPAAS